jgi:folate-binding Fe-S cluster repair protein YgfZ
MKFAAKVDRNFMALHKSIRRIQTELKEVNKEPNQKRLNQLILESKVKAAEARSKAAEASATRSQASEARFKADEASALAAKAEFQMKILQLRNEHLSKSPEEKASAEKLAKVQFKVAQLAQDKSMAEERVVASTVGKNLFPLPVKQHYQ